MSSQEKVCEQAKLYRKHGFPLDGIHIDVDIQDNYKTFTTDKDKFPDPRKMLTELRDMGIPEYEGQRWADPELVMRFYAASFMLPWFRYGLYKRVWDEI